MRRVVLLALCVSGAFALTACPAKPKNGECKTGQDCVAQAGYGKVCIEGRCQECGQDSDCKDGFVCRTNRCVPKPQCGVDADCPAGQTCQGERCVAPPVAPPAATQTGNSSAAVPAECESGAAFTVRFGFDQATLAGDAQASLQKLADCLKRAPAKRVVVQGNADERGTAQYNVALGSRRAEAARKYLSDLGAGGAIDTVSYGKERPVCTQSSEDCWAKNRRDDFQIDR